MRDGGGPGAARPRVDGLLLMRLGLGLGRGLTLRLGLGLRLGLLPVRLRLLRGDGCGEVRGALGGEGRVGLRLLGCVGRLALLLGLLTRLAGLREAVAALWREAVTARVLGGLGVRLRRQRCARDLAGERLLLVRLRGCLGRLRRLGRRARLGEAVAAGRLVRRGGTGPLRRGLRCGGRRSGRLEGCLLYTS
uniref:hypothetical protein n=1 Tax=Streptomyces sp. t99 TaxID=1828172 RepID=UPI0027BACDD7